MGEGDRRTEITLSASQVERLEKQYPGAKRVSEAVRQAVEEAVRKRERELTQMDIREAVRQGIEESDCLDRPR